MTKIYFNETAERYITQDSFTSNERMCDFQNLCPDEAFPGKDNIIYMGGIKQHGLSIIDFKRLFLPGDMYDAPISMDGPTQVIVAIGSMGRSGSSSSGGSGAGFQYSSFPSGSLSSSLELENTTIDFSLDERENRY